MIFLILGEETDYETVKNYTGDIWKQYAMDLDKFVLFGTAMCNKCETMNVQQRFTYVMKCFLNLCIHFLAFYRQRYNIIAIKFYNYRCAEYTNL
jgi:hypothetical protein